MLHCWIKIRHLFSDASFCLFPSFVVCESTAGAYKRFVDGMVEWMLFVKKQIEMRVHNKYPTIDEDVIFRRVLVGMKVILCFYPRSPDPRFFC